MDDVMNKSQWADLPVELRELILRRLFGNDITRFLAVCTSWRSTPTCGIKHIGNAAVSEIVKHPFLLRFRGGSTFEVKSSYCELYSPAYNKMYLVDSLHRLLADSQIHSSNFGWLLLSRGNNFFFLNPSTTNIINLPPDFSKSYKYSYNKMAFSAPPTSLDCVVFGLIDMFARSRRILFGFLRRRRRRDSSSWSWTHYFGETIGLDNIIKWQFTSNRFVGERCSAKLKSNRCRAPSIPCRGVFKWCCSSSPVFHNGAFYCLSKDGVLGVFRLDTEKKDKIWRLINTTLHKAFMVDVHDEPYLMESPNGELISVVVGARGESIRVFKFDENVNVWQNVYSLEDHVVFLSRTSCLVIHCDDLPVKGLRNTIHFPRFHGNYNIFYSLSTNKFHTFYGAYTSQDLLGTQLLLNCTWMVPNFSFETSSKENPNYFIRNLAFLQPTGSSNRNISSGENKSCKVMEREASSAGQAWIMLHDDGDGGSEQVSCTLVDVFGGISYPMHHLGERLKGLKIYASGYGKLLMMNISIGDCILLDISSMTIYPLPMLEDYKDKYKTSLICLSPQDSKLSVMIFSVIKNREDREENGKEGDQNDEKEDEDDYENAQDNGEEQEVVDEDDEPLGPLFDSYKSSIYLCQVGDDKWSVISNRGLNSKVLSRTTIRFMQSRL